MACSMENDQMNTPAGAASRGIGSGVQNPKNEGRQKEDSKVLSFDIIVRKNIEQIPGEGT